MPLIEKILLQVLLVISFSQSVKLVCLLQNGRWNLEFACVYASHFKFACVVVSVYAIPNASTKYSYTWTGHPLPPNLFQIVLKTA